MTFLNVFKKGELYLSGIRIDDIGKDGDINLYIVTDDREMLGEIALNFLLSLKNERAAHRFGDCA